MGKSPRDSDFSVVEGFLQRFGSTAPKRRYRLIPGAPLDAIQRAAIDHPSFLVRRAALAYLDHYANDESGAVFAAALRDPIEDVRNMALHAIACERCKSKELCAADVVPALVDTLRIDPSPEVRHKTISTLIRFAGRDPRALPAIERVATEDSDAVVR